MTISRFSRPCVVAAGLFLGTALTGHIARADVIAVPNFSFESPALADGNSSDTISNWTKTGVAQTINPNSATFTNAGAQGAPTGGDGAQSVGLLDISSIQSSASLATVAANTNYSLTVAVGRDSSNLIGNLRVGFLLNGSFVTGSSATFAASTATTANRFQDYTFNFTPTNYVGQALTISLGQTTSGNFSSNVAYFDNVRLSSTSVAPVPEPSTWAMMALGVGALGLVGRKRKRAGEVI